MRVAVADLSPINNDHVIDAADLPVEVRVVRTADWSQPIQVFPLDGGQGTINVNGRSPDSRQFAYLAYPSDDETQP